MTHKMTLTTGRLTYIHKTGSLTSPSCSQHGNTHLLNPLTHPPTLSLTFKTNLSHITYRTYYIHITGVEGLRFGRVQGERMEPQGRAAGEKGG